MRLEKAFYNEETGNSAYCDIGEVSLLDIKMRDFIDCINNEVPF